MDDTNPDWAPSQHLGYRFGTAPSVKSTARYERAKARLSKKTAATAANAACSQPAGINHRLPEMVDANDDSRQETPAECSSDANEAFSQETVSGTDAAVQTDVTMACMNTLEEDRKRLVFELQEVKKQKMKLEVTEASLRDDPGKVMFYTGLSTFTKLFAVFQIVESVVKHTQQNGLCKFQEFVVFLMKLKCNFPLQDLGCRRKVDFFESLVLCA
ncbi:hypothetical protein MTO96_051272 [Rhipicephalus appendiculatus]